MQKVYAMAASVVIDRLKEALQLKSDRALASYLGITPNVVYNWKVRDAIGDWDLVFTKCGQVDLNWLVRGGTPEKQRAGIPLIPMEAVAGYGAPAYQDMPVENYYDITEFAHADFLIRVTGDSMTPKYKAGDIVACRAVQERKFWQWHTIYVIATRNQGVLIKRVEEGATPESITCVSENPAYRPFQVPLEEIMSVALVMGAITLE